MFYSAAKQIDCFIALATMKGDASKTIANTCELGMVWSEHSYHRRKIAVKNLFGLFVMPLVDKCFGKIVRRNDRFQILWPQHAPFEFACFSQQFLGFCKLALISQHGPEILHIGERAGVLRPQHAPLRVQRLPSQFFGFLVPALLIESHCQPHFCSQCGGIVRA